MIIKDNGERHAISIRLLEEEMEILEQKAKEAGMTKSEFIRRVIRHGEAHPKTNFSHEDRSHLQHEIDRIGNNLNLIGYIASGQNNSSLDEVEVLKLVDNYKKLLGKIYDFIHDKE